MGNHLFEDLPKVMEAYRDQLYRMVSLVAQRAALAGGSYLAEETPVDTGVARSNWVATVDAPFIGTIPAYVPYPTYRQNHHEAVKGGVFRVKGTRKNASKFFPSFFKGKT